MTTTEAVNNYIEDLKTECRDLDAKIESLSDEGDFLNSGLKLMKKNLITRIIGQLLSITKNKGADQSTP